jgi:hypothetical protein
MRLASLSTFSIFALALSSYDREDPKSAEAFRPAEGRGPGKREHSETCFIRGYSAREMDRLAQLADSTLMEVHRQLGCNFGPAENAAAVWNHLNAREDSRPGISPMPSTPWVRGQFSQETPQNRNSSVAVMM